MRVSKHRKREDRKKLKKRARERKARQAKQAHGCARAPAKKEEEEEEDVIFSDHGNPFVAMSNGGRDMCALLTLIALWMLSVGIPYETVFAAVNGELTKEMKEKVQWLRKRIVEKSDGHPACDSLDRDGTEEPLVLSKTL